MRTEFLPHPLQTVKVQRLPVAAVLHTVNIDHFNENVFHDMDCGCVLNFRHRHHNIAGYLQGRYRPNSDTDNDRTDDEAGVEHASQREDWERNQVHQQE